MTLSDLFLSLSTNSDRADLVSAVPLLIYISIWRMFLFSLPFLFPFFFFSQERPRREKKNKIKKGCVLRGVGIRGAGLFKAIRRYTWRMVNGFCLFWRCGTLVHFGFGTPSKSGFHERVFNRKLFQMGIIFHLKV